MHGLPYKLAWQDLKDWVRTAGVTVVRADIMTNPDGTSKGYGIVQLASAAEAAQAIRALNGSTLEGRIVTIKHDKFAGH